MKTLHQLLIALAIMMLSDTLFGQTNVSGILYNNTTWTKANSPYIVTDSVVVFPGVTLTIEPGVEVRFEDSTYLHVKDATMIALGNVTDSITFTSNSSTPFPGIWGGISFRDYSVIQLQYSNFLYAKTALIDDNQKYIVAISNSTFRYNNIGIGNTGDMIKPDNCSFIENYTAINETERVINCQFINNGYAIRYTWSSTATIINYYFCGNNFGIWERPDSLINCVFTENHRAVNSLAFAKNNIFTLNDTAMKGSFSRFDSVVNNSFFNNHVGIVITSVNNLTLMSNNTVCNNTVYNIVYDDATPGALNNICFCETDSAIIASKIYDAYDNINLGILDFTPYVSCDSTALPPFVPTACSPTTCNIYVTANVTAATCGGCSDGQATANVVGISTAPYTYTWYSSLYKIPKPLQGFRPALTMFV